MEVPSRYSRIHVENSISEWEFIKKIVVGNKIDIHSENRVPLEEARGIFERHGIQCFETSAATGAGVANAIDFLINCKC